MHEPLPCLTFQIIVKGSETNLQINVVAIVSLQSHPAIITNIRKTSVNFECAIITN